MTEEPKVWDQVFTLDSRLLGVVREVGGNAFLVQTGGQNVWLRWDAVYSVEGTRVTLLCNEWGVGQYVAPELKERNGEAERPTRLRGAGYGGV